MDEKTTIEVIRKTDIHAKLTWLPKILGLKDFIEVHSKTIKKIADERNSFIHYKWKSEASESFFLKKDKKEIEIYFREVKRTS